MANTEVSAQLLSMLCDGQFHSGTALGEQLGISRAAVWKQLQKLENQGVAIESVKGKGYRVANGLKLLDAEVIRSGLSPKTIAYIADVRCQLSTRSTNADALAALQQGDQSGLLVLAEEQTAGRGRRGRQWVSPFARNLYFSLVWSFDGGAAALEGLSLLVGLSVVKALASEGCEGLQLKWPNDIWCDQKKLAGVLLEMSGDASGFCQVVIGVGVNVSMQDDDGDDIEQEWTSLQQQGCSADRNVLMSTIANQLVDDLAVFTEKGFAVFKDEWMSYDVCYSQAVMLSDHQGQTLGVAKGVDDSGALLVEVDGALQRVIGGEVSLRLQ